MTKVLLLVCLVVGFPVYAQSQNITISVDDVPLKKVFKLIERKSNYVFAYRTEFLAHATQVSVHIINGTINQVMEQALKGLGLNYLIVGNMITVRPDTTATAPGPVWYVIEGRVTTEAGQAVENVSVVESGTLTGTVTQADGQFTIDNVRANATLTFSCVGYELIHVVIKDQSFITIRLKAVVKDLDEMVITGYGKTSKRFNTGSIYKLNQADIARQPVSNPLAVLQGRVPGLLVTQTNGLPGGTYKVQLRGQSSIGIVPGQLPPNDPLFIIDGVPFAPNNNSLQAVASGSALGESGRSPFALLNPGDIDHIEVLKDADACAIYGSRGANGVVLISTKKGKQGIPVFNFNVNTGLGTITRYGKMMNTGQYVHMRREALLNDGLTPDAANAPDLFLWDTTRYTNFKELLIGGRAVTNKVIGSLSGGSKRLQYYIGSGYYHETTVFPGSLSDNRASGHLNLHYQSKDTNFNADLSVIYSDDKNNSILNDLTKFVDLAPNTPVLYDASGKLNWQQGDLAFSNPMALLLQTYEAKTSNMLANLNVGYNIAKNLVLKTSLGYNWLRSNEIGLIPGSSQNPYATPAPQGSSYFGKMIFNSWIAEPQIEYSRYIGKAKISALSGATMQIQNNTISGTVASDFPGDEFLKNLNMAGKQTTEKLKTEYRYAGVFARLNGNINDTYILNLTGRRDASSRFGPGRQVGTFWAAGMGWIFSNEPLVKDRLPFISFGKLRVSYGITGNDQIGDYKYLDKWQKLSLTYQGNTGIAPVQLADSNYSWEVNRKFETAIDWGLFKDRLLISIAWYRNRSGNQLIAYTLPGITGFTSYAAKNSPALVQNTGWEIMVQSKNKFNNHWQWNGNITLTIPRNKLISFPHLETSSYASSLVQGQSLSVKRGFVYTGVDRGTGLFTFEDRNGDGRVSYPKDYRVIGNFDPVYYGAFQSNLQYKGWQLDFLIEVRRQNAYSYLYAIYDNNFPGTVLINQPVPVFSHWEQSGDAAQLQQYTTGRNSAAVTAMDHFVQSNGVIKDASFWRLRNIELSWRLPPRWVKNLFIKNSRVYVQAQNLFTITRYKGTDPETQNTSRLPPLRVVSAGVELSF